MSKQTRTITLRRSAGWGRHPYDGKEMIAEYSPLPHHLAGLSYTKTGYGKKIPTAWTVNLNGRRRRIYTTIYGNVGTCWIVWHGEKIVVN